MPPVGAELFHADDRRTDKHEETNSRFFAISGMGLKIPRSAHTVYWCVLCGSENKQRLFPYTTLTDWFL